MPPITFLSSSPSPNFFLRRATTVLPSPTAIHRLLLIPITAKQYKTPDGRVTANKRFQKPSKHASKERDAAIKHFSTVSPSLSPDKHPTLSATQAVGMVAAEQANYMRVVVQPTPPANEGAGEESGSGGSVVGGVELLCVVRALLKKIRRRVLVGDKVVVGSIDWDDRRGMIEDVFERKSVISDPPIANVDHYVVLFSMDQPKIEPFTLTRFLVEAESANIPITLALNKTELVDEEVVAEWTGRIRSWGYEPILCSVDSKLGLDTLASTLRDRTSVIVGPSGVGKSSLINALRSLESTTEDDNQNDNSSKPILGGKWYDEQRVGEVSARSGRGKHTTRNVSLLPLAEGGYLADTPGFNQPTLIKVTKQSLAQAFPEIRRMLEESEPNRCAFNNCLHLGEPGCVVPGDWERYPFYFQLLDEIRIREQFQLRTLGTKRESDVKIRGGAKGVAQAEPRLELKKHRRISRKRVNQAIWHEMEDELNDDDDDFLDDPILREVQEENK